MFLMYSWGGFILTILFATLLVVTIILIAERFAGVWAPMWTSPTEYLSNLGFLDDSLLPCISRIFFNKEESCQEDYVVRDLGNW
jgi:NhaP-type Na+/H+ or K+/H+ antiporter